MIQHCLILPPLKPVQPPASDLQKNLQALKTTLTSLGASSESLLLRFNIAAIN
ncbi:hypothetical protein L211DRAFT_834859 [Terfezia boudieri ATCC MYA-4762]|uniref:Uncharacterized protein n=1 Tax=Terfezia boudieri ATCC MYA-4762 TaxID=1051890 RepID=A0A3N4M034_9PEZI|nr:hypothetical protein L211DRAFT_834859 [Terfezia boudieri ATCC MYA-4762]